MADIADLENIVGAAQLAVPTVDWNALEREADFRFPDDYKRIFEVYPHLQFDRFLGIFHPGRDVDQFFRRVNVSLESPRILSRSSGEMVLVNDDGQKEQISPLPIFPKPGGLFPWGATENGDLCLWATFNVDPNKWPVVITDHIEYWRHEGGVAEFLVGIMRQTVRCPIFPVSFPSEMRVDQFEVSG